MVIAEYQGRDREGNPSGAPRYLRRLPVGNEKRALWTADRCKALRFPSEHAAVREMQRIFSAHGSASYIRKFNFPEVAAVAVEKTAPEHLAAAVASLEAARDAFDAAMREADAAKDNARANFSNDMRDELDRLIPTVAEKAARAARFSRYGQGASHADR